MFKVGEVVRIISQDSFFAGTEGEIVGFEPTLSSYGVQFQPEIESLPVYFSECELEIVLSLPGFKVGDRVRIVSDSLPALRGYQGEIVDVDDDPELPYEVRLDSDGFMADFFNGVAGGAIPMSTQDVELI